MAYFDFNSGSWLARQFEAVKGKVLDLRARWKTYTAEVRAAQLAFNEKLERAADVIGVTNVERLMAGKPPQMEYNVWDDMRAHREAAAAARPPVVERRPFKPLRGSAEEAQLKFNEACERYADKHGIVALEKALTPSRAPVPVSDPEPKRKPDRHKYDYS